MLPEHFPPCQTVYAWFVRPRDTGVWEGLNFAPIMADRERAGRGENPTAAVMDSRSVRTTEAGGPRDQMRARPRFGQVGRSGASPLVKGRKGHAPVDTGGRLLVARTGPASVQERDGAGPPLEASRGL